MRLDGGFAYLAYLYEGEAQRVFVTLAEGAAAKDEFEQFAHLAVQNAGEFGRGDDGGGERVEPMGNQAEEAIALEGGEGGVIDVGSVQL